VKQALEAVVLRGHALGIERKLMNVNVGARRDFQIEDFRLQAGEGDRLRSDSDFRLCGSARCYLKETSARRWNRK